MGNFEISKIGLSINFICFSCKINIKRKFLRHWNFPKGIIFYLQKINDSPLLQEKFLQTFLSIEPSDLIR